jgi:hypothetical protein
MDHFAYLAPVGPFAGLSNAARQKISEHFPTLSIIEIESATASFLIDLAAPKVELRLAEARNELNIFAKELARLQSALNQIRAHRLDHAIGEASRMVSGKDELDNLERSLKVLRTAIQQASRSLPFDRPQLASSKLIGTLARYVKRAGLPLSGGTASSALVSLVDLIFEDLMVGGDATSAVREWQKGQAAGIDHERAGLLLDLVP